MLAARICAVGITVSVSALMGLQVVVQVLQFLSGEPAGDNLTGTFGATCDAVAIFVYCPVVGDGDGLLARVWRMEGSCIRDSRHSCWLCLGCNAVFSGRCMAMLIVLGAIALYFGRGKRIDRTVLFIIVAISLLFSFPFVYDRITAETRTDRHMAESHHKHGGEHRISEWYLL